MKTRALVMAGVMALSAMATTRVAQAQEVVVVNIPFDFSAGNKTLPAGEYSVRVQFNDRRMLLLERKDSSAAMFILTNNVVANAPQSESKLIFNRYGDRYFLSQVWNEGDPRGWQLTKTAREKEIAQTAKNENEGQVTLVAELARTHR
jgi:hypothetical protein